MRKIVLMRHAESIWNKGNKFTGWTNIPLTQNGEKECIQFVKALKKNNLYPNMFFSSVLKRSIDTTNIIKKNIENDQPIYTSWRLNEKHYGTLEGVSRDYIKKEYGQKFTHLLRNDFYIKPPVIPEKNRALTKYNIYKNCYYKKIKNGESKENVLNRLLPYFENDILYNINNSHVPLVVTHKHCLRVLMKHYLELSDEEFENYKLPKNSFLVMNFDNELNFKNHKFISI